MLLLYTCLVTGTLLLLLSLISNIVADAKEFVINAVLTSTIRKKLLTDIKLVNFLFCLNATPYTFLSAFFVKHTILYLYLCSHCQAVSLSNSTSLVQFVTEKSLIIFDPVCIGQHKADN